MKHTYALLLLLFFLPPAYGQLPVIQPGVRQAVGVVSTIGRGLHQAKAEQDRQREAEERDYMYTNYITLADTFYSQKNYEKAIAHYQKALELKNEQYPKDRLALANAALGRQKNDPYQLAVDAADSLFNGMRYEAAVLRYNEAAALKDGPYPKEQAAKANAEIARWKKVHFSGLVISDARIDDVTSKAYSDDPWSDFVSAGKYPWIDQVLTYANFQELDGIAVPANTRLVIYSERNYKGTVLLDVTGPAIISNTAQKTVQPADIHTRSFALPVLEETFPAAVRTWSANDMHLWVNGSMEITTTK